MMLADTRHRAKRRANKVNVGTESGDQVKSIVPLVVTFVGVMAGAIRYAGNHLYK